MRVRGFDSGLRRVGNTLRRAGTFGLEQLERALDRKYASAPVCSAPLGSREDYLRLWRRAIAEVHTAVDEYERECRVSIDKEWFHQLALVTQVTIKQTENCYQHGRLLYAALRRYAETRCRDHLNVVETGTARGFSALCLSKALSDSGASGKVVTFDVLPHDAQIYWNCIHDIDGPRTRAELLQEYAALIERHVVFQRGDTRLALRKMTFPRIHFAFLDSVHSYDHVMAEFAAIRGRQRQGDILFFDDYTPGSYPGVVQAADEICRTDGYAPTLVAASAQRRYLIAEKQ